MNTTIIVLVNYVFVAMFDALLVGVFTQFIYDKKFNLRSTVLYTLSATVSIGTIINISEFVLTEYSIIFAMTVKTLLTFSIGVFLLKVFYKISFIKSAIAYGMFFIILGIGNAIVQAVASLGGYSLESFKSSTMMQIFAYLVIYFVSLVIILFIKCFKLIFTLPHDIRTKTYWTNLGYIVFAFVIITVANTCFMKYNSYFSSVNFIINIFISAGFLIFSIINTNTFFKLESKSHELEYQIFYNKALDALMNDLRRIKHNHSNMLAVLGGYIKIKKWDELEKYFSEVCSDLNSISSLSNLTSLNIKSAGILGLIMSKLEYAQEKGVNIKILNTDEVREVNMKISELCEVLGILMDNAIEAASESDNKSVDIIITKKENIVSFSVENSMNHEISINDIFKQGFSSKGEDRGFGLWVVKKIVGKYENVSLNTQADNISFKQELIIL